MKEVNFEFKYQKRTPSFGHYFGSFQKFIFFGVFLIAEAQYIPTTVAFNSLPSFILFRHKLSDQLAQCFEDEEWYGLSHFRLLTLDLKLRLIFLTGFGMIQHAMIHHFQVV